ncbi:MAG: peptidoglycan-binding protein [Pseudomonadota bacterium]
MHRLLDEAKANVDFSDFVLEGKMRIIRKAIFVAMTCFFPTAVPALDLEDVGKIVVIETIRRGIEEAVRPAEGGTTNTRTTSSGQTASPEPAEVPMTRDERRQIQAKLNDLGIQVGTEDGIFGKNTRSGIATWQSQRGSLVTGYLTAVEKEILLAAIPKPTSSSPIAVAVAEGSSEPNSTGSTPIMPSGRSETAEEKAPEPVSRSDGSAGKLAGLTFGVPGSAPIEMVPPSEEMGIIRSDELDASTKLLLERYGMRLALVPRPSNPAVSRAFLEEVRPGSIAEAGGLRAGDVFVEIPYPWGSSYRRLLKGTPEIESVNRWFLNALEQPDWTGSFLADVSPYVELEPGARVDGTGAVRTVLLNQQRIVDHIGFELDPNHVVVTVLKGSPAESAGVQIGDVFSNGFGTTNGHHHRLIMERASRKMTSNLESGRLVPIWFSRNGRKIQLDIVPIGLGSSLPALDLSEAQLHAFNALPHDLKRFFEYLYVGEFETAERYYLAIFDRYFGRTAAGLVASAFGSTSEFRDSWRENRAKGILAQYILIKTNQVGLCASPGTSIRVEQERYEVWTNGYGVEVSARRQIEPRVYEFDVPTRWLLPIRELEPMGEVRQWAPSVRDFVGRAGGCTSELLPQLEERMLEFMGI